MLNDKEKAVLVGLCDEFITETNMQDFNAFPRTGWTQTSITHAARETGMSLPQIKGYLSKLQEKGYIKLDVVPLPWGTKDYYITLQPICKDVIVYDQCYGWQLK